MKFIKSFVLLLMALALLTACGTPATQTPQTPPEQVASPTPEPKPAVGGTFVYALRADPTTLDFQNQAEGPATTVGQFVGAALLAKDPKTNQFVPWLAKDWKVSDDGMTWEFKLRDDVKFHDGTPFKAADMAWTLNRAIDKEKPTYMAALLEGMAGAEAVDDTTLKITMQYPSYALLSGLASTNLQPMSQAYVEKIGDGLGHSPMSVGPYKFKEWKTSEKVVLERNPDYTWGPAWSNGQPPMIETIEFRIIPEYSTRIAGLEAGEIDFADLQIADVERMNGVASVMVVNYPAAGVQNGIFMNVEREPFTDVRVRQAFNYAIDKDAFIKVMGEGRGEAMYSPITSNTRGYWSEAETIGYHYDLEKAKTLMAEAGWMDTDGDGILDKDGKPLTLEIKSNADYFGKLAVVFQDQMKALGVQVNAQLLEMGVLIGAMDAGDYTLVTSALGYEDSQAMYFTFHSSMMNYLNTPRVSDPDLDKMLDAMAQAVTEDANLKAGYDAQKRIIEQAYMITTFSPQRFFAISKRAQGSIFSVNGQLWLDAAYIVVK
jgi:peptide/nickel transport system substrate-binding protein